MTNTMATKKAPTPQFLTVVNTERLTPNMQRIILQGDSLRAYTPQDEGAYIKLAFPQAGQDKPALRTYTIARLWADRGEIAVDFMLHDHSDTEAKGLAAPWALQAKVGDHLTIFGPGPASVIQHEADWYLLAGDMTALPALATNLKTLPDHAQGYAFIEIMTQQDQQTLVKPDGIQLHWVINPEPAAEHSPLFEAVQHAQWLQGQVAAWVACEFSTMRKIRHYLKQERQLERSHLYASSYWKKGKTEEEHKVLKSADNQASLS